MAATAPGSVIGGSGSDPSRGESESSTPLSPGFGAMTSPNISPGMEVAITAASAMLHTYTGKNRYPDGPRVGNLGRARSNAATVYGVPAIFVTPTSHEKRAPCRRPLRPEGVDASYFNRLLARPRRLSQEGPDRNPPVRAGLSGTSSGRPAYPASSVRGPGGDPSRLSDARSATATAMQ
jgi:hypothetical protein